jgi:glucose-1-phosphate adenylyltransferase
VPPQPPAKFVLDEGDRVGMAVNRVAGNAVIVSGGQVRSSVLSPGVRVAEGASVGRSVLLDNVRVEPCAVVENTILDKNVVVRPGASVGVDLERDRERGFTVSAGKVTVVGECISQLV